LSTPLAVSPNYSQDQTLLAGVPGLGLFKSTDGGQLWQPSSAGLSHMMLSRIFFSPTFARDQTVFAGANYWGQGFYRSRDGGLNWQILPPPEPDSSGDWIDWTLSSEFDQDQTLFAIFNTSEPGSRLYLSQDSGDHWRSITSLPQGAWPTWVSVAPLFARWQTLFVAALEGERGLLYRSTDGGSRWEPVLETGPEVARQMVYAPDIETNRPIFLLGSGTLYGSTDGGSTWQELQLPAGITPTALAISPTFAQDRLLFLGTAEGQVLNWVVPE
jgi:photosystem II stability/assembly factor-like uncharacterized protein